MKQKKKETDATYWHPAFYAGIQIELEDDADNLVFENEHQLGKKPMEIDVLIIKKETDRPVKKNIGRIFKKYNIIEYKSPDDSLSVDDFYKVYGYTCFYKVCRQHSCRRTEHHLRIGKISPEDDKTFDENQKVSGHGGGKRNLLCERRSHPHPDPGHKKLIRGRKSLAEKPDK